MLLLVKYLVNQDVKIDYDPQQSAVGNAVGESAARKNLSEVCKPHYRASAGIVVAGPVSKYQVHRIGVSRSTVPGFNLDYTEHRVRCIHATRVSAAVTEACPPMPMSAISSK